MKALGSLVIGVALVLSGCGGGPDDIGDPDDARPAPSASAPSDDDPELATTDVCELVRQGIDEFNLGDLVGTIDRFEEAVPKAEELADDEPSDKTETLLDAVRYYAELPAGEYLEASVSSPEFLRFKDFTLTECAYAGPPAEATDPALPA